MPRHTTLHGVFTSLVIATLANAAVSATLAPASIDLGPRAARSAVRTAAWLINTGAAPLHVVGARADSLAVDLDDDLPSTVAPGSAAPVGMTITVPDQPGAARTWTVTVELAGRAPVTLPVSVEPAEHDDPFAVVDDMAMLDPLRLVPARRDFGAVAPAEKRTVDLWLVNAGTTTLVPNVARTSCGCMDLTGFRAGPLPPGGAVPLTLTVTAPAELDKPKQGRATVLAEDGSRARAVTWIEAVHPLVDALHRYRDAVHRDDGEAQLAILADDSRIWFDRREGPGAPRGPSGDGPWSGWDREMGAETETLETEVEGDTVRQVSTEVNDYYRLIDRPPSRMRLTYWFDDEQRIEGLLVEGLDDATERHDRRDEFLSWAREHRSDDLEGLLEDDRIVPSAEHARRWRRLLLEWRRGAGLPIPRMPEWEARLDRTLQTMLTAPDEPTFVSTLADGYRQWVGTREGEGLDRERVLELFAWDRACGAALEQRELVFEGDRATGVFHETNEVARLLGFPGWTSRRTFWFDERGRLAARLDEPLPGPDFDAALAPALQWLQQHRAAELAEVYSDGRIVQSRESAERWLVLLQAWRAR